MLHNLLDKATFLVIGEIRREEKRAEEKKRNAQVKLAEKNTENASLLFRNGRIQKCPYKVFNDSLRQINNEENKGNGNSNHIKVTLINNSEGDTS